MSDRITYYHCEKCKKQAFREELDWTDEKEPLLVCSDCLERRGRES